MEVVTGTAHIIPEVVVEETQLYISRLRTLHTFNGRLPVMYVGI